MKNKSLYSKLYSSLIERIKSLEIGDAIPSERTLCTEYGVSRTTVRNAISELELNGFVKRVQGKGTFVISQEVMHNLSDYFSFTDQIKRLGQIPSSEIIEYHIENANPEIRDIMNLTESDLIITFLRLRKANDTPMMLETTSIKYDDFPEITKKLLEEKPLYEILKNNYGVSIYKVIESFSVSILSSEEAKFLDVKNSDPCLNITRVSSDMYGSVIEYTKSLARADKFVYRSE